LAETGLIFEASECTLGLAMAEITDFEGRSVRLTDERWAHISEHPEMAGMRAAVEESLREPETVIQSLSDPEARLYYRLFRRTPVGEKYLCIVVKTRGDNAFVVTAYLTDRVKRGSILWPQKP
jgi:hypothetical protein